MHPLAWKLSLLIYQRFHRSRVKAIPLKIWLALSIHQIYLLGFVHVLILHFLLFTESGRDLSPRPLMNIIASKHMYYYTIYSI
jgi:hypothetical protein